MTIKFPKGLGLLGKMILFSLISSFTIAGSLVYLYDRDLKEAITQKYIEEALSAASAIQERIRFTDFLQNAPEAAHELDEILKINPNFIEITIYGRVDGAAKIVHSTRPERHDRPADLKDLEPLSTGRPVTTEKIQGESGLLETIAPYREDGKAVATIGIYVSTVPRDILVAHLSRDVLRTAVVGSALILMAIFYIVHRVLLVRLRQLTRGCDMLAGGSLDHRIPISGQDEMSRLMKGFNTMAASLQVLMEREQQLAITDGLTGLVNHREFQRRLEGEIERSKRYNREFSLLMADIDYFKTFNDTYGHPVGDQVLKEVGVVIRQTVRTMDISARYGGEEFAIIAPETTAENAKLLAERLRNHIADHRFMTPGGHAANLSVSIGVASFPLDASEREGLICAADQALYFAKEAGRNVTCLYNESLKSAIERNQGRLTELLLDPDLRAVKDLASAIDAKTPYTRGHSEEVTRYAVHLADALGLDEVKKESLRLASLLHNIGTVSVPDRILNKSGPLSIEERKIIQAHPMLAEMILKKAACSAEITAAILYHHERFDGTGYPNGFRGDNIPYLARVLSVVESYHAMISVRPYRRRLTPQEAMEELQRNAGAQFDPAIVETFVRILRNRN